MRALWHLRGACLAQVLAMGLFSTFEAVHMADAGLSPSRIGWLLALENGLFILVSPLWGEWADRTQRYRRLIALGTFGCALNMFIFALAETPAEFLLYAVLRGLFSPGIQSLMPTLAVVVVGPAAPGKGFGRYRAFGSLGFMLGNGVLPLICGDIATTCLVGATILASSLLLVFQLPRVTASKVDEAAPAPPRRGGLISAFFVVYALLIVSEPGVHAFFGAYARDLGADVEWVGGLASMTGLMALLGLPVVGAWVDRFGAARVLLIAFLCHALRMAATALIDDYHWLWTAHLFHFVAWPGREVGAVVLLAALSPAASRARVLALLVSVRMVGMTVGSFLMGQLIEEYGYVLTYWIEAGLALMAVVCLWRLTPALIAAQPRAAP